MLIVFTYFNFLTSSRIVCIFYFYGILFENLIIIFIIIIVTVIVTVIIIIIIIINLPRQGTVLHRSFSVTTLPGGQFFPGLTCFFVQPSRDL